MRIGILTVPFNNNYGGILQAYALKNTLQQLGYEVLFINRRRNKPRSIKYKIYSLLVRLGFIEDFRKNKINKIGKDLSAFVDRELSPLTPPIYSSKDLNKEWGLDYFIVGSDQVWRYQYAKDSIKDYFFEFLTNTKIPRMSYAASFGTEKDEIPEIWRNDIKKCLDNFTGISVREKSAINILHNIYGVDPSKIKLVLDPTLLLSRDYYLKLCLKTKIKKRNYIAFYILDNESMPNIETINTLKSLDRINLKAQTGNINEISELYSVEYWLSAISNADVVLTDSFHGTVFSIIFNRPFYVFANKSRGVTRLQNLLSLFNLQDRFIDVNDVDAIITNTDNIDWSHVNERIKLLREESIEFLVKTLNINK